jgi:hypothetical protein
MKALSQRLSDWSGQQHESPDRISNFRFHDPNPGLPECEAGVITKTVSMGDLKTIIKRFY